MFARTGRRLGHQQAHADLEQDGEHEQGAAFNLLPLDD
jgi:hypothetical protein